jgi:hypothetical protein
MPASCVRGRATSHRLDKTVRAHVQETVIILPFLADEDRLDRRLQMNAVVRAVIAAPAQLLEQPLVDRRSRLGSVASSSGSSSWARSTLLASAPAAPPVRI